MPEFTVTVDSADLAAAGYHGEDECDHDFCVEDTGVDWGPIVDALEQMHQALHPGDSSDVRRCLSAPCNRLVLPPPEVLTS